MVEVWRGAALPSLDEVVYYVNAACRALEFAVALCVVAYGAWESLWGEWSWIGASVIIIHSYCNVWLRAQAGWKSFLLRQEAARKINSLPRASAEQLQEHSDVCAICFQVSIGFLLEMLDSGSVSKNIEKLDKCTTKQSELRVYSG